MDPSKLYVIERKAKRAAADYEALKVSSMALPISHTAMQEEMEALRLEYSNVVPAHDYHELKENYDRCSVSLSSAEGRNHNRPVNNLIYFSGARTPTGATRRHDPRTRTSSNRKRCLA